MEIKKLILRNDLIIGHCSQCSSLPQNITPWDTGLCPVARTPHWGCTKGDVAINPVVISLRLVKIIPHA